MKSGFFVVSEKEKVDNLEIVRPDDFLATVGASVRARLVAAIIAAAGTDPIGTNDKRFSLLFLRF